MSDILCIHDFDTSHVAGNPQRAVSHFLDIKNVVFKEFAQMHYFCKGGSFGMEKSQPIVGSYPYSLVAVLVNNAYIVAR